jgi:transposase-like protein
MTPREKSEILIRILQGETVSHLADEIGVAAATIRSWCQVAQIPTTATDTRRTNAEQFVRIWQRAESILEVSMTTGADIATCRQRASHYRAKGVPLKKFAQSRAFDWGRLAKIAEECANGEE